jgi:thiaminase/transcriptional activator TenA
MLHTELREIADPVLRKVQDHPFWAGLRDGTLPGEALAYFVEQDTAFLLPAYARALARCAAVAADDTDAALLAQSAASSLYARDRLRAAYQAMAGQLGTPQLSTPELGTPQLSTPQLGTPQLSTGQLDDLPAPGPATHAHASYFAAASAASFHDGLGALLPMVWFNAGVSDHLKDNAVPGTRYVPWIETYHPGESYKPAVQGFQDMVDRAAEACSPRQRQLIVEQFSVSIRYEWAFADGCLRHPSWPV